MKEAILKRDLNRQQIKEKMSTMAKSRNVKSNKIPFCPLDYSKLKSGNTKCWQGYRRE